MPSVYELLGKHSPLKDALRDFRPRSAQQRMAMLVEEALAESGKLLVEAGTGIGKTFAYLIPAVLSGQKVIISTATKHLQDQLFFKDLPVIQKAIGTGFSSVLLKGRANYLCVYRLQLAVEQRSLLEDTPEADLQMIREWAGYTHTGDIAELSEVAEHAQVWSLVTSTVENCLGQQCPCYQQCHVVNARRRAQKADLVIINHHLFCADLALKEEGFGEVLPSANAFILDEAHQLPEIAADFFGHSISSRQLNELAKDVSAEGLHEAPDMQELRSCSSSLKKVVNQLRLSFGNVEQRAAWHRYSHKQEVQSALAAVQDVLAQLTRYLEIAEQRGKGLQSCCRRAQDLSAHLQSMHEELDNIVHWVEIFKHSFILHLTPLNIGNMFQGFADTSTSAWILTSATLSVGGDFTYFQNKIGFSDVKSYCFDSPYDYEHNTLLYLPRNLPEPGDEDHTRKVVAISQTLIELCKGKTFLLFTSHRSLQLAAELLYGKLAFPMLVQGQAPKRDLINRFRQSGEAVLLGTHSFWEGVDVRGPALSCVVIDKLPFASPSDPVFDARCQALKAAGENPFFSLQIPHAVISLKQGIGRLIRDVYDTGVLTICDPRITTKHYGRVFINNLPKMPVAFELKDVEVFLQDHCKL